LAAEFKYIDKVFENGDLETITKDQLKNFMMDRANRKIKNWDINHIYRWIRIY
jgi:ribonucleoside-diphosphate reductase beta chain